MSAVSKIFTKRKRKGNPTPPSGSNSATTSDAVELDINKNHDKFLKYLDPVIEVLNVTKEASEMLPPLKLACGVTIRILSLVRGMVKNDADWNSLIKRLEPYSNYLNRQCRKIEETQQIVAPYPIDSDFKDALDAFLRTLNRIQAKATDDAERFNKKKVKSYLTQAMKAKIQTETIQGLGVELDRDYERLKGEIISCIHALTLRIQTQTSQIQLFQRLNSVNARGERILPLTLGTRTAIIERLQLWAVLVSPEEQIFWLCDEAGTGKSTVASEMVRRWKSEGCLAARFFFDGQEHFTRTTDRFCVTIAKEIFENHPRCEYLLSSIIEKHRDLDSLEFDKKFKVLISDLLEGLNKQKIQDVQGHRPLILVIDSLDECIAADRAKLMKALTNSLPPVNCAKVFLTSRSLPDIERALGSSSIIGGRDQVLLDVRSRERDKDIAIYVKAHLGDRFSPQLQKSVVDCSNGLFLSASLACSALLKKSPSKASHAKLLTRLEKMTPNDTFRELYQTVLEVALVDDDEVDIIRAVLKGVALPFQPISIYTIGTFFPLEDEEDTISCIDFYVQRLGSIMKDGTPYLPVHLVHPTFRVYLESLHPESSFYFPFQPGHAQIAGICLGLLCSTLTYDICNLEKPNEPLPTSNILALPEVLPAVLTADTTAPVRYAISFWTHHASLALDSTEIKSRMKIFFEKVFLMWLEWASILGVIPDVLHGLTKVWNQIKAPIHNDGQQWGETIEEWSQDALRFVQRHEDIISRSGMQTYTSALAFTPYSSLIYRHYSRHPLHPLPKVQGDAHFGAPAHRILDSRYRLSFANCTFLAGGKQLVLIGVQSGRLEIWDVAGGSCQLQIAGHDARYSAGAYSKDGSLIASGASNGTICLWDIYGGSLLAGPYDAHSTSISCLTFGSSDKVFASGDSDGVIRVWNTSEVSRKPKKPLSVALIGHTAGVSDLAASPVSDVLVSCSRDHTIRLWDLQTTQPIGTPLCGHTDAVIHVVISIDGRKIASGSRDGSVRLWNISSRNQLAVLIENGSLIDSLILSPDKDTLVASLNKGEIHRWSISSQKKIGHAMKEHNGEVVSMRFTPNGRYLTTGSRDYSVRIWDLFSEPPISMALLGHTDHVFEVAINSDGTQIVSTSLDDTIRIWDIAGWQGSTRHEDERLGRVLHLLFSNDGSILAASMESHIIQLWNVHSGSKLGDPLSGHTAKCEALAFSHDGTLLVTGAEDRSVRLWNTDISARESIHRVFNGHAETVKCVAFLGGVELIVSGSADGTMRMWNSQSQICLAVYVVGSCLSRIACSPDGLRVAAYSKNHSITLWDATDHRMIGSPIQHTPGVSRFLEYLSFSPDSRKLLSFDPDKLKIFDVTSGLYDIGTILMLGEPATPTFSGANSELTYLGHKCLDISRIAGEDLGVIHTANLLSYTEATHDGRWPSGVPRLYCTEPSREIHSYLTKEPILIWPPDLPVEVWAVYEDTVALGTRDGKVLILKFPDETAGLEVYHSASSGGSKSSHAEL